MLRPIFTTGSPNGFYPVDPTAEFQAGMIGGLIVLGGEILMTVSDGITIQPYGIIDDIKAQAFQQPIIDEQVVIPATADGYGLSVIDVTGFLQNASIVSQTFTSDVSVTLIAANGVITVPSGTVLNFDNDNDSILDSILVTVSYTYETAGLPGDDTTLGSGQMTVWFSRGEYMTDQYDTTVAYNLNSTLYCGNDGKLTSVVNGPGLAMVTKPPQALDNTLNFLWF